MTNSDSDPSPEGVGEIRSTTVSWLVEEGTPRPRIVLVTPGGSQALPLRRSQTLSVGRAVDSDLRIAHSGVSRRHLTVHVERDRERPGQPSVDIEDLDSSNGTRLNERELPPRVRTRLRAGDVVGIGPAFLMVQLPGGERATAGVPGDRSPIAVSERMTYLFHQASLFAESSLNVLILGETGVGKDVLAEALRSAGPNAKGPFIRLACAALDEAELDRQLFGIRAEAGGDAAPGLLQAARGGVLFLDQVGELAPPTQTKLLRALESDETVHPDPSESAGRIIRCIATSSKPLREMATAGVFRRDLYFRLAGLSLDIPPLRERIADILPLARHFLRRSANELGAPALAFSESFGIALQRYPWPGNVRELQNEIQRAARLGDALSRTGSGAGKLSVEHLSEHVRNTQHEPGPSQGLAPELAPGDAVTVPPANLTDELEAIERSRILRALEAAEGNQSHAARLLGISRGRLIKRLDAYGIERPRKGRDG